MVTLISHSRRTLSIIHQNIGFSLAVKAIFVILAFAGRAIAAGIGASLLVVYNGLQLLSSGSGTGPTLPRHPPAIGGDG